MDKLKNSIIAGVIRDKVDVREYSALNLAYIGDAVFEIYARTKVVIEFKATVNEMNKKTCQYVSATAQSEMYHKILEVATDEEIRILKRGRNATSHSSAKNATKSAYRHATGVETLIGYLYLTNNKSRLDEIFELILK